MHDLASIEPDVQPHLDWEHAAIPARRVADSAVLHVRAKPSRASQLEKGLNFAKAGRVTSIGSIECLWLGPAEWLLIARAGTEDELSTLAEKAAAKGAALADAGARLMSIDLGFATDLVAGLAGLPLASLQPGHAARTRVADIAVTVAVGPDGRARLMFDRVYAGHLRGWLDRASYTFLPGP